MKSNVLKSSLTAFVFALAIVASFAFSPALNSTDEVAPVQGYIQTLVPLTPCAISISTCEPSGLTFCTVGFGEDVYALSFTSCQVQLYLPDN